MEAVDKIKAADSPFSDSLFFAAGALSREIEKLALECWKPSGLSPSLGQVLYYLLCYARVTGPMIIARNLFLSPSTVTRLLEKLEKKGLVLRFNYDRMRMVQASDKAFEMESLISECMLRFERRCAALIGEETGKLCLLLTTTADILRCGTNVRKPTEKPAENTDLSHEKKNHMETPIAQRRIEAAYLEKAITYEAYTALIADLLAEGRTTGPDQSVAMVHYTQLNQQRMHRLDKVTEVLPSAAALIRGITLPQTWLVLTEAWCGDAAQSIPVMHALASLNPLIQLKFLLRDENPALMDRYLTNGVSRSIPKLIGVDTTTSEELFTWGPRPAPLQAIFMQMKADGVEYHQIKEELQRWYNKDKTATIQLELSAAAGAAMRLIA